jgi:formylglycine-generating enzyme required for sulfatase activity
MTPVPWPSFTPHPYVASTQQRSPKDDMAMVYVPPGLFLMGSNTQDDTTPEHEVSLDGYWVDQTEVTNAMYRRCVDSGLCSLPEQIDASIYPKNYFYDPIYNNYPVAALTWYQAATYCKWADRRLLTEAEWEKAARGTDHRIYAWGDTDPFDVFELVLANFAINDFGGVTEVGRFPAGASPYGALDMAGNVAEWVSDWYEPDYYSKALSQNPQGPSDGEYKVLRGGGISGDGSIDMILTYYRDLAKPDEPIGGVRCGHSIWQ